jgi:predicted PurR-regulated permease PerM
VTITRGSSPLVPSWLGHLSAIGWRVLVTVGLGLAVIALCFVLSTTVLSLLLGFILSATLAPYATRLRARGWSGIKAAGAITAGLLLGVGIILALIFGVIAPPLREIAAAVSAASATLSTAIAGLPNGGQVADLFNTVQSVVASWVTGQAASVGSTIATIATIGMLGLFMTFFLLADGDKAWSVGVSGMSEWRRDRLEAAGQRAIDQAGGYLRGTAISAVIKAGTDFAFLLILGVPFAGPLALLVLFGAFVPYVGAFVTTSIMLLVAYGAGGAGTALLLFVLIVAVYALLSSVLAGRVFPQTVVTLHPAIVLVALPIGYSFAGLLGMALAVPTVGFLAAIVDPLLEVLGERRDDRAAADDVPLWLDRIAQWSWRLLVAAALGMLVVLALAKVPLVVGPIVVAITLAATFLPALRRLQARGLSRFWASTLIMVVLWVSIILVVVLSLAALIGNTTAIGSTPDAIADTGQTTPQDTIKAVIQVFTNGLIGTILTVFRELVGVVFFLVLTALLSFFCLEAGDRAWAAMTARLSAWRRRQVEQAGTKGASILGGYMIATGVLGAFNAITGFIIMVVLGLPLAFPIALLSFLGGFIPYIGQALTSLLAFLVAIKFGTTQDVVIMGLYTIVMNVAQGSFIAPLVYGRAVSIHPAIVLMAIPAGGELAGVLGMFLAVPVIGVFAAVWRNLLAALGDQPASTAPDPTPAAASEAPAAPPGIPVAQPEG